jgi:hypothetical protein
MDVYGANTCFLSMLSIQAAHAYLKMVFPEAEPGKGVRIAFFDSGFRFDHRCLQHLHERDAIVASYDFVDRDTTVWDPDSVVSDSFHPFWRNDEHGTQVASLAGAYDPPYFSGVAWGAEFVFARTEQIDVEIHAEEDNWAEAVVWAESLGVDIISSSLGYSTGFSDTVIIVNDDGMSDTLFDYAKSDLDGKTTIVSRAARYAAERGIIVVNAAGNEQFWGDTSLSAPADVEEVISVGSVDRDGTLSVFSSLGPTGDGRNKPDLVAPGGRLFLPNVYEPDDTGYSARGSGTSFATPLIAGGCALIRQSNPGLNAGELRSRIYRFCSLPVNEEVSRNAYGRGIPDVLRSCMRQDDELFLMVRDGAGEPIKDVIVSDSHDTTVGSTDLQGVLATRLPGGGPAVLYVHIGNRTREVIVDSTPFWQILVPCSLVVTVRNSEGKVIPDVNISAGGQSVSWSLKTDSSGNAVITDFIVSEVKLSFSKPGYERIDTSAALSVHAGDTFVVCMTTNLDPLFQVYPTVFRKRAHDRLFVNFVAGGERIADKWLHASIRSLNGNVVWKKSVMTDGSSVALEWDVTTGSGADASSGLYFLVLFYDGKNYRQKILIAE